MIEQLTSGVDWLTCTLPLDSPMDNEWVQAGLKVLFDISDEGYRIEERGLLGYKGWSAGNCFVGSREDGHMMQFTGYHADKAFKHVYRPDMHISRVDVQVTVKHDVMPQNVAGKAYKRALNEDLGTPVPRKRKIYIITGSDGGQTLYVGSPSSDQRGRLYNKEVQSEKPEYARTWRYEVVLRNERATQLCNRLQTEKPDYTHYVSAFVALWFETRSIEAPWSIDEAITPIPPLRTLPTDVERSIGWLKTQVAPTVRRLIELGYRDTILEVLGIDPKGHAAMEECPPSPHTS